MVVTLPKLRSLTDETDLLKSTDSPQHNGSGAELENASAVATAAHHNGRPPLRAQSFVFDPGPDDPDRMGIALGFLDPHGIPLTPSTWVAADSKFADLVLERGQLLIVSESNPALARFIAGDRRMRRARYYEMHPEELD
jgi:hypothetical protein